MPSEVRMILKSKCSFRGLDNFHYCDNQSLVRKCYMDVQNEDDARAGTCPAQAVSGCGAATNCVTNISMGWLRFKWGRSWYRPNAWFLLENIRECAYEENFCVIHLSKAHGKTLNDLCWNCRHCAVYDHKCNAKYLEKYGQSSLLIYVGWEVEKSGTLFYFLKAYQA
jgi:hypothetical protein